MTTVGKSSGSSPPPSDEVVVEFMRLYTTHARRLYGYILCFIPNLTDADDLLQDTCSVMWSKYSDFTPGSNFMSWAMRIARLVIANHLRKANVRKRVVPLSAELQDAIACTAESCGVLHEDHRVDALQRCLSRLRDKDRMLLHWRYEGSHSIKSISQRLGRSIDMVYKALSRIHSQLLECIEHRIRLEDS